MDSNKPHDSSVGRDLDDDSSRLANASASPRLGAMSNQQLGNNHQTGRIRGLTTSTATASAGSPFFRLGATPGASAMTPGQARGTPGSSTLGGRGMPLASPRGMAPSMSMGTYRPAPGPTSRVKPSASVTTRPASSSFSSPSAALYAAPSPAFSALSSPVPEPEMCSLSNEAREENPLEPENPILSATVPPPIVDIPEDAPNSLPDTIAEPLPLPVEPVQEVEQKPFVQEAEAKTIAEVEVPPVVEINPIITEEVVLPTPKVLETNSVSDAAESSCGDVVPPPPSAATRPSLATIVTPVASMSTSDSTPAAVTVVAAPVVALPVAVPTPAPAVELAVVPLRTLEAESKKLPLVWGEETPQFWAQFNQAHVQTSSSIKQMESVSQNLAGVARPAIALDHGLIREYTNLLDGITKDSFVNNAIKALSHYGTLSSELAEQFDIASNRERKLIDAHADVQAKMEEYERLSTTYSDKIKRYLLLKTTTDSKKLQEKSFKLANLQHQLEMARYAAFTSLYLLNETITYGAMSPLVLRTSALFSFFKSGYEHFRKLEAELDMVSTMVRKQTCRADEIRAECRKQNDSVERSASEQQRLMSASSTHSESSLAVLTNALGVTSANSQAGVRDLDPRRANKQLGFVKRGYLYSPFPSHTKVWVELDSEHLSVYPTVGSANPQRVPIVLCTVKHNKDQKLRHVFTVISPQTQFHLQAEHEAGYNQWFDVIQNAISEAINHQQKGDSRDVGTSSPKADIASPSTNYHHTSGDASSPNGFASSHHEDDLASISDGAALTSNAPGPEIILTTLRSVPGNTMCADCSSPDPEWLSLNLGILICLKCSGVHRSLGVHTSKVRSSTMDSIDPNALEFMRSIGNRLANSVWEEELYNPSNVCYPKCTPLSTGTQREQYIRLKYEAKKFVNPERSLPSLNISSIGSDKEVRAMQMQLMSSLSTTAIQKKKFALTQQMFEAIQENNMPSLYRAMCWGCDPLWSTAETEGRNAAHQSVMYANIPAAVCVMYNCADKGLYSKEDRGWTVLHYAAYQNSPSMIELCLTFGGSKLTAEKDNENRTPEDIVNTMNIGPDFEKDKPEVLRLLHTAAAKYRARIAREEQFNKM